MPTIKEVLCEKTYKGDLDTVKERVFYTLTDIKGSENVRIAKALSLLIEQLYKQNVLIEKDIDDLLLDVVS